MCGIYKSTMDMYLESFNSVLLPWWSNTFQSTGPGRSLWRSTNAHKAHLCFPHHQCCPSECRSWYCLTLESLQELPGKMLNATLKSLLDIGGRFFSSGFTLKAFSMIEFGHKAMEFWNHSFPFLEMDHPPRLMSSIYLIAFEYMQK